MFYIYFALVVWGGQALAEASAKGPTALEQFVPFIFIGLIFYFLLIRPNQKRQKNHQEFLSKIKRGDEVITSSGIFGSIQGITDTFVILKVSEETELRILKTQVASYFNPEASQDKKESPAKDIKKW